MAIASIRELLLAHACERLGREGMGALQARGIARSVGVSTTALYTHFGSMAGLTAAVCEECFRRLTEAVEAVEVTDDALVDLLSTGLAYRNHAIRHPYEYELMFDKALHRLPRGVRLDYDAPPPGVPAVGVGSFGIMVTRATRLLEQGRIAPNDPAVVSAQLWAALHGFVTLELAGHFGPAPDLPVFAGLFANLFVGMGAERADVLAALGKSAMRVPMIATGDRIPFSA